jgi:mannosyltransferase
MPIGGRSESGVGTPPLMWPSGGGCCHPAVSRRPPSTLPSAGGLRRPAPAGGVSAPRGRGGADAARRLAAWPPAAGAARLGVPVLLGALLLAAAALRLRALSAPYWIDEGISVGISSHPLGAIPGLLREDGSPPLYYVVLHGWMAMFGTGPVATHALSAAVALACVPVAWWALARFGAWAGLSAAALMAFDPYVGLYADETRMYSLLLLLALGVCGAFLRAFVLRRRAHLVTFALLVALTLYTHPWGAYLVAACGAAWLALVVLGPERGPLLRDGAIAFGAAALLFAPWVPTLLYQAAHTGAPWSHRPTEHSLVRAGARIWSGRTAERALLAAGAVGLALSAARGPAATRRAAVALAVIALVTLGAAFAYARFREPAWALRYLVVVLAPLAAVTALGLGRLSFVGVLAVLLVAVLVWDGRPSPRTLEHKSNVAAVAHELAPDLRRGTLVFSTQPEQVPELEHELPAGMRFLTPLGAVADPRVMDWRDALARLRAARFSRVLGPALRDLPAHGRLLVVQPRFSHPDSPWTRDIRAIARRWGRALRRSPLLRRLRVVQPARGSSRSTVDAILLERRPSSPRP